MVQWVGRSILHGGARCSSVVREFAHGAMSHRIDPPWGGSIENISCSSQCSTLWKQRQWYVLSCLWDDAYKRTLAANQKQ